MNGNADEVNWVEALSKCSLAEVFERLRMGVQSDVRIREAQRPKDHTHYSFQFVSEGRQFSALLDGPKIHQVVNFSLDPRGVTVRDETGAELFIATTTLNDEGECRLKVKGQERELWQVRKMALEGLLFGGAEWSI